MKGVLPTRPAVLPNDALEPMHSVVPAPNRFTHVAIADAPYYFAAPASDAAPADGHFDAGSRVVLLVHDGGAYCRVVDAHGIYAETRFDLLRKL
jgi:hypothetical protein